MFSAVGCGGPGGARGGLVALNIINLLGYRYTARHGSFQSEMSSGAYEGGGMFLPSWVAFTLAPFSGIGIFISSVIMKSSDEVVAKPL